MHVKSHQKKTRNGKMAYTKAHARKEKPKGNGFVPFAKKEGY